MIPKKESHAEELPPGSGCSSSADYYVFNSASGLYCPRKLDLQDVSEPQTSESTKSPSEFQPSAENGSAKSMARWGLAVSVATLLMLIGTVIYAGLQWRETVKATKATEISAYAACVSAQIASQSLAQFKRGEIEARASADATIYQAIAATQSQSAIIQQVGGKAIVQEGKPILMSLQFIDNGSTPAYNFRARIRTVFIKRAEDPDFSYPANLSNTIRGSEVLQKIPFPDNPYSLPIQTGPSSFLVANSDDVKSYIAGDKDVMVFGSITYTDTFRVHHEETFCIVDHNVPQGLARLDGHPKCAKYSRRDANSVLALPSYPTGVEPPMPSVVCNEPK